LLKPIVEVPKIVPAAALFKIVKVIAEVASVRLLAVTLVVVAGLSRRRSRPI
jgi:hypothetical protein